MDQEKPFKTIEVIDSRTSQVCKVACMSCIRGHRTTSCGIPVCRPKVFWTVKRPGRPSNSCTCRYGATGGCKCVVARSACPHKSKKGEKRSGECRCDEQGRYCCLLEPEHWLTLLALGQPTVDFYPTREALEARQAAIGQAALSPTSAYSGVPSPHPSVQSVPSTPGLNGQMQSMHVNPNPYTGYSPSPSTTLTPRFGMMGIGAPMGSQHDVPPDVLAWEGQAPPAPREYNPVFENLPQEQGSCCRRSPEQSTQPIHSSQSGAGIPYSQPMSTALSQQIPPVFDLNRFGMDYFNYQFPSAICQNCGLNGCTCKNCPPPFQNYGTGNWGQSCGRKHARDIQPSPAPLKIARTETYDTSIHSQAPQQQQMSTQASQQSFAQMDSFQLDNDDFARGLMDMQTPTAGLPADFGAFGMDNALLESEEEAEFNMHEYVHTSMLPEPLAEDEGGGGGTGGEAEIEPIEGGSGGEPQPEGDEEHPCCCR